MLYTVTVYHSTLHRTIVAENPRSAARQVVNQEEVLPSSRISVADRYNWVSYRYTASGQLRQLATYG